MIKFIAMQNAFEQLEKVSTSAPQDFEEVAWLIIQATEGNVRKVALSRGDGGIDAAQGTWGEDGEMHVFQAKYYPDKLEGFQKTAIIKSFQTAKDNPHINLTKWTLVLPARLRRECLHWFEEWKKTAGDNTEISLWDGDDLTERLERPACAKARGFLKDRKVTGIGGEGPSLVPFAQTFMASEPGLGFVVSVTVENKGSLTAVAPRLTIQYSETGCRGGAHNQNWWKQEEEAFMGVTHRNLNGLRDIHPNEPAPILQILLRKGDSFEIDILVKLAAKDYSQRFWQILVTPEDLRNGALVQGAEISAEAASELVKRLSQRRTFSRPQPTNPLAVEILGLIRAHQEDATKGLTVIRQGDPGDPTLGAFIPSSRAAGSVHTLPKEEMGPAIIELQQLGWLGNPHPTAAVYIYRFIPEPGV